MTTSAILDIVGRGGSDQVKPQNSFSSCLKQFTGKSSSDVPKTSRVGELGVDSVGIVLLHNAITAKLGVTVPFEILLGSSVADVDKFIARAQTRRIQVSFDVDASDQWASEITLPGFLKKENGRPWFCINSKQNRFNQVCCWRWKQQSSPQLRRAHWCVWIFGMLCFARAVEG